ncbi:single-strand binding protein family [Phakopsora pachyrhizi]|uniref:Single-strand binding protein family n=1 Tax=Phakopsora pachyrhizi TaxID=170000 RepID=A0AAV0B5V9_PHAPC|nr:single-strand binding protein family [Phakopsora pachyrhizi]KAI8450256.1 single-strand binding protein family [Phakopsora pachyrhizi]CAH7681376.1 single-strand binding protein family [Phakopsora pachyrhizi]
MNFVRVLQQQRRILTIERTMKSLVARREYSRMSLIGNLVQDARVIERGSDKEPMVAIKVATNDRMGRESREAGREPTSSYHDILSFNPGLNKYLSEFKKGSLVHVEADVKMQQQEQSPDSGYQPPIVRLTLREITKLRNPKSD